MVGFPYHISETLSESLYNSVFRPRGQPDIDRGRRRPRVARKRTAKTTRQDLGRLQCESLAQGTLSNGWGNLPPLPEIVDGINQFTRHYFQLGFIPKEQFPRRILKDRTSVSVFLVVSILSISARLSRPLSRRYGSGIKASEFFMKRATEIALGEIFPTKNTLENCQAFYLLSIAQQGNGLKDESHVRVEDLNNRLITDLIDEHGPCSSNCVRNQAAFGTDLCL